MAKVRGLLYPLLCNLRKQQYPNLLTRTAAPKYMLCLQPLDLTLLFSNASEASFAEGDNNSPSLVELL